MSVKGAILVKNALLTASLILKVLTPEQTGILALLFLLIMSYGISYMQSFRIMWCLVVHLWMTMTNFTIVMRHFILWEWLNDEKLSLSGFIYNDMYCILRISLTIKDAIKWTIWDPINHARGYNWLFRIIHCVPWHSTHITLLFFPNEQAFDVKCYTTKALSLVDFLLFSIEFWWLGEKIRVATHKGFIIIATNINIIMKSATARHLPPGASQIWYYMRTASISCNCTFEIA